MEQQYYAKTAVSQIDFDNFIGYFLSPFVAKLGRIPFDGAEETIVALNVGDPCMSRSCWIVLLLIPITTASDAQSLEQKGKFAEAAIWRSVTQPIRMTLQPSRVSGSTRASGFSRPTPPTRS